MTDKQKNLVIRSITGVFFVVCMVSCFLNPRAMVILFALITGLSIWEYCGLVNQKENVTVNRFISTVAGVYFFLAVADFRMGIVAISWFSYLICSPSSISSSANCIQATRMPSTIGLTLCSLSCTSPCLSR